MGHGYVDLARLEALRRWWAQDSRPVGRFTTKESLAFKYVWLLDSWLIQTASSPNKNCASTSVHVHIYSQVFITVWSIARPVDNPIDQTGHFSNPPVLARLVEQSSPTDQ